jgi:hypothetical protein
MESKNAKPSEESKCNRKVGERDNIDAPNIQMHDSSLSWIGTNTLVKRGEVGKSLKIPKGVTRRHVDKKTDNTMAKQKRLHDKQ